MAKCFAYKSRFSPRQDLVSQIPDSDIKAPCKFFLFILVPHDVAAKG